MSASTLDQLKSLWARLNSDPNAQRARKFDPDWVVLQWEPQGLVIVEATVGDRVALKHVGELSWGGASNPEDSTASAGSMLKDRLAALKISTRQTAVIVGRDAVVLRRLELPFVPDNELPDMVRFQAAAKSSTPIDRLALDFVPLETPADAPRVAVTVTMDSAKLRMIQETVVGAGLELAAIGLSATALAALISDRSAAGSLEGVSVVLLQKGDQLELALLDGGRLAFAHTIRLEATDGGPALQPLQAELNRALVAMSQAHGGGEVSRVFIVPGVNLPATVHEILEKRFPGLVQHLDPRDAVQMTSLGSEGQTLALKAGPAIGQLVAVQRPLVPQIDFVNPRKRIEAPDTRKAKIRAIGGGLALLALMGYWQNTNAIADREAKLAALREEAGVINVGVNSPQGKATRDAAAKLKQWKESNPRPLLAIEKLTALLPPTSEFVLTDLQIKPGRPTSGSTPATVAANISALAWTKSDRVCSELESRMASSGYNIAAPQLPDPHNRDPEYPLLYQLSADQLIPPPAPPPKPAAAPPK